MFNGGKHKEKEMINRSNFTFLVGSLQEEKNNSPLPSVQKYTHLTYFFCDCETHAELEEMQRMAISANIWLLLHCF